MPQITKALTLNDLPAPPPGKTGWPWTEQSKSLGDRIPDSSKYPRISIVTPSYNQGKFIEEAIRSVLLQGYPNLEYIIIDGGSTDNSVEVIKKYESHLAYWISEKDNGQAHAINKGLKVSTGSILGWINSDDLYARNVFEEISEKLRNNQHYVLVHGNRILINESSQVTGFSYLPPFVPHITQYVICSETVFWRRTAMEQVGLLKENLQFAMDLEFFGRLYFCGKFLKTANYLGYFRCYKSNKSSTMSHIRMKEASEEWKQLFGFEYISKPQKLHKLTLLKELASHPLLIGFPYASYKLLSRGRD